MDKKELQRRAGITEQDEVVDLWKQYTRISEAMARALRRASIDTRGQGGESRGSATLNPLQANDIEYHVKMVVKQLNRLDKSYHWREYMAGRKVQRP